MEHLREAKAAYVLVDQDPAAVDDLVRIGEPVKPAFSSTITARGIAP